MKKIVLSLLVAFSVVSCGLLSKHRQQKEQEPTEFFMMTMIERLFTYTQLDSLCTADGLSSSPEDWSKMFFIDGETNEPFEQYMYLIEKGDTTFIYTAVPENDKIFVTKRIQYEN